MLCNPQRQREEQQLQIRLPSSSGWLRLVEYAGGEVEQARAVLLDLLQTHAATVVEAALAQQVRRDECSPGKLLRALVRKATP